MECLSDSAPISVQAKFTCSHGIVCFVEQLYKGYEDKDVPSPYAPSFPTFPLVPPPLFFSSYNTPTPPYIHKVWKSDGIEHCSAWNAAVLCKNRHDRFPLYFEIAWYFHDALSNH